MLAAFDAGADDYVVKPFPMKVLLKRIRAVLRRTAGQDTLTFRDLTLCPEKKEVYLAGEKVALTPESTGSWNFL